MLLKKNSYALFFRYDEESDRVGMSYTKYKPDKLNPVGKLCMFVYKTLHIVHTQEKKGEDGLYTECNNLTLINLLLKFLGPLHERTLVILLLGIQVSIVYSRYKTARVQNKTCLCITYRTCLCL